MEDLNNIWNAEDELNEEELMNYVKNKSSPEEQRKVEENITDSLFVSDAVEGLQNFSSTEKMNTYIQQINGDLHKRLHKKRYSRKKSIGNLSWEIIAVIIVIVLCALSYTIIEMTKK